MAEKMTAAQWDKRRKARLASADKLPASGTVTLAIGEQTVTVPIEFREFSSGSKGYFAQVRGNVGEGADLLPIGGTLNLVISGTAPFKG